MGQFGREKRLLGRTAPIRAPRPFRRSLTLCGIGLYKMPRLDSQSIARKGVEVQVLSPVLFLLHWLGGLAGG